MSILHQVLHPQIFTLVMFFALAVAAHVSTCPTFASAQPTCAPASPALGEVSSPAPASKTIGNPFAIPTVGSKAQPKRPTS